MQAHSMCLGLSARATMAQKFTCDCWRRIADENRTRFRAKRSTLLSQTVSQTSLHVAAPNKEAAIKHLLAETPERIKVCNLLLLIMMIVQVRTMQKMSAGENELHTQDKPDRWSLDCIF